MYYNEKIEDLMKKFSSNKKGLTKNDVKKSEEKYGRNALKEEKKKNIFIVFLEQFKDLLVAILIVAAIISAVSGEASSTYVIIAVLVINAILGTIQHVKAEKSLAALKAMSSPKAKVLRNGEKIEIDSSDVVVGDILLLEAGDLIAADGRIIENFALSVNESSLTGESVSVSKISEIINSEKIALGDQKNMVFSGSLVSSGRAVVLVTSVGMDTQIGKIATLMNQTKEKKTPLQKSLDNFSKKLAFAIIGICVLVFLLGIFKNGETPINALMFAVALAVAAIPEALSSIVTIVLAMGTQKMAKENAIVKNLKSVESLGCVSIICSDKTGTLTQNKMTTQNVFVDFKEFKGEELKSDVLSNKKLIEAMLLANDSTITSDGEIGDPTETCLVRLGRYLGINEIDFRKKHKRIFEIAFDSDRKLMSTVQQIDGENIMYTKGAIDTLLDRCNKILIDDEVVEMSNYHKERIIEQNEDFSKRGIRVLTFAYKELDKDSITFEDENNYIFIGLVSMIDPPRPESKKAVLDAKTGGIKTIMITGDHKVTASAIAKEIGIFKDGDIALDGIELDEMEDSELEKILDKVSVYARVSPEHKIKIVDLWQKRGNIVSMTGDGVNDAPALKKADVGVAMGITGTEVSKDAASMVLTDDNFATIVKSVVFGRNIYTNIKNAIKFLLSGNMSGILSVLYASLIGLPAPFAPVHLLFINLLTDSLPAIAIGMEKSSSDLLKQKPRNPKEPILTAKFARDILIQGFLIGISTMIAFYIGFKQSSELAMTMAFATLTLARLFHGFNCRADASILKLGFKTNYYSIGAFLLGVLLLNLVLFVPGLNTLFKVASLSFANTFSIYSLALVPTLIIQVYKIIRENVIK